MPKTQHSMQFTYWDLIRKGKSQTEVSDMYGVSRQAVSKTVKSQNHKTTIGLLELARSVGALVEWHDETRGILVCIIPQLQDNACLILLDQHNQYRVFYDRENESSKGATRDLQQTVGLILGIKFQKALTFNELLNFIVNRG